MPSHIVIVGAGLAGLVAANRAAELGQSVIVLEQGPAPAYPCNSRIATGVFNLAHSDPEAETDQLVRAIDEDTEGHADGALAAALAGVAGRGLAWLRREGATFVQRTVQDKRSWLLTPPRSFTPGLDWQGRGPDVLLRTLAGNLERRGGRIVHGARARALGMADAACRGVVADIDGRTERFDARAVLLADGGFQGNPDLVRRHISPRPEALVQRSAGSGRGDAIVMAEAAGAALVDMAWFYGHLLSRSALQDPGLWPYPTLDTLTGGGMLVDRQGRRFVDEGLGGIVLCNLIARRDDPLEATAVFDDAIWNAAGRDEVVAPNPGLVECGGELLIAGDLATLAAMIGVPATELTATVAAYNEAVDAGRLDELAPPRTPGRRFGVRRSSPDRVAPRPIATPPFYAAPIAVGLSCTMGGIAIDCGARALDADRRPIAGLYAAGSTTGGIEGGPAAGYIGGLAKAYGLGLIAAESIAGDAAATTGG